MLGCHLVWLWQWLFVWMEKKRRIRRGQGCRGICFIQFTGDKEEYKSIFQNLSDYLQFRLFPMLIAIFWAITEMYKQPENTSRTLYSINSLIHYWQDNVLSYNCSYLSSAVNASVQSNHFSRCKKNLPKGFCQCCPSHGARLRKLERPNSGWQEKERTMSYHVALSLMHAQ